MIALVRCTLATPGTPPGRIDEIEFGSIYVSMVGLESDCGELPPDAQPATSRVVKSCLVNARRTVRRAAVSPAVTTAEQGDPPTRLPGAVVALLAAYAHTASSDADTGVLVAGVGLEPTTSGL